MAKIIISVGVLLLVVAAAAPEVMPPTTEPVEHVVAWIVPPESNTTSFYSNLLANITFRVSDTLVFNFTTRFHNVVTLAKKNYDNCTVNDAIETFNTGPARITLNHTGEFYFACAIPTHCDGGQKLSINVTGSSSPGAATAEAPSSSPAGSVAATFSVLLMAIAINVLF